MLVNCLIRLLAEPVASPSPIAPVTDIDWMEEDVIELVPTNDIQLPPIDQSFSIYNIVGPLLIPIVDLTPVDQTPNAMDQPE